MSLKQVLSNKKLWQMWYYNFSSYARISVLLSAIGLSGWLTVNNRKIKTYFADQANLWIVVILALTLGGVFLTQIRFAMGGGSVNFRYMLPAILSISLVLGYGLLSVRQLRGQLVSLVAILMGGTTLLQIGHPAKIVKLATVNGVPSLLTYLILILFPVGVLLLGWSLWSLSGSRSAN